MLTNDFKALFCQKHEKFLKQLYLIDITHLINQEYEYEHISSDINTFLFEYKHTSLRIQAHLWTFFLSDE